MTLSDISIKNPVFGWMLMIGILVFGWISFERLGISQLPDVDFPVITVNVTWEGAAPEVIETEVTDIIEDAVMSVEGIKEVSSESRQGSAQIKIDFEIERNVDLALQDVQAKIAQAQRNLPKDIDPPVISKTNPEDQPIMWVAFSGNLSRKDMSKYVNEVLKDQFTSVSGVGDLRLGGYVDPNLRVWLSSQKLQDKELTVEDVLSAIDSQHTDLPAGYMDAGDKEVNVRVYGETASPEEFEKITIKDRVRGGPVWSDIRIKDVGRVEDGLADIRRISRSWGEPAIGMGIIKQRGSNAVAVASAVNNRIEELRKRLPSGTALNVVFDSTQFIKDSVNELKRNLFLAIILTSIVCFLFLGSWTATVNVLLAIPTSVMGAFMVFYFMGYTINTFTMLGLSLVIGIVVDDAIMVLENISRYQEKGMPRVQSALIGAREITFAALASTLAILAIFIPVIFMKGILGKFFVQFGVAISVAVMFSLLEALTITPMRCSQFLVVGHTTRLGRAVDHWMKNLMNRYRLTLEFLLKRPGWVLVLAIIVFAVSLIIPRFLKKEFVPSQDQSRFLASINMPLGSSIENTDAAFKEAEKFLMSRKEVDNYFSNVGGFSGQVNQGSIFVTMKPLNERPMFKGHHISQQEFMQMTRKALNAIPGIDRAGIQDLSQAGFSAQRGYPIQFTIRGPEWKTLGDLAPDIMKKMKASGLMADVDTDYNLGMPELQIRPDREKAAAQGVSVASIADTVNALIGGVRNGKFTSNGKRYDIRVRLEDVDRSKADDISKILIRNQSGELVHLSSVINTDMKGTLFSITRKNRERAITINANPAPGHTQQEALHAVEKITKEALPAGYRMVLTGGAQVYRESFSSLQFTLILGIFVAYMILGTQFNSFIHPLTVLLALPFSLTGAYLALLLTGNALNLYSSIGLILLMGIVKKNSIMLVDFTNVRRSQGMNVREALLDACPIRLRPILMTSIAMIAAAIPGALSRGSGSETIVPMAVTIIGGVLVSTILTLFVVPCAYILFSKGQKVQPVPEGTSS